MKHRIPGRLNLCIAAAQLAAMLAILWAAGQVAHWWAVALLSVGYGIVNSGYAMLHEAEHGILHPHRGVNNATGIILALFFPAPFHLIRQGHIGHHIRNRGDDEAFDLYFENESRFWKCVQLYGTLTGLFWVLIYVTNTVVLFRPSLAIPGRMDRTTEAFLESLNPRYHRWIQAEAFAVVMLHAGLIWTWHIPLAHYFAVMFGFGLIWSSMQYAHHYGTERDVLKGARNLRTFRWLDLVWINHNWHRNHHSQPTVPWVHLPRVTEERDASRGSLVGAYFAMWHGARSGESRGQIRRGARRGRTQHPLRRHRHRVRQLARTLYPDERAILRPHRTLDRNDDQGRRQVAHRERPHFGQHFRQPTAQPREVCPGVGRYLRAPRRHAGRMDARKVAARVKHFFPDAADTEESELFRRVAAWGGYPELAAFDSQRRHLRNRLAQRCHRRLEPFGPNDGTIFLAETLRWPGQLCPVWGADHYLRPRLDVRPLLAALFRVFLRR